MRSLSSPRPDVSTVLAGLKDFQRATVDHVFRRMYLDAEPTRRFLVADEVGLGKTHVARGLIARAVDHLWDTTRRIDVVYVCSNGDIARQNVNRLNITGTRFELSTRITLLPIEMTELGRSKLNFISITPRTSFELAHHTGQSRERELLYHLLETHWGLLPEPAARILQGGSQIENFRQRVRTFPERESINGRVAAGFYKELDAHPELRRRFDELCSAMPGDAVREIPPDVYTERQRLLVDLRMRLARCCLRWLEPDLIILDEFQRFEHLLTPGDGDGNDASRFAEYLFNYQAEPDDKATAARVLLLSATPYRMYSQAHESAGDGHHAGFRRTLDFLQSADQHGESRPPRACHHVDAFRRELYRLAERGVAENGATELAAARRALEDELRQVIVRTERLALSPDRNGMLRTIVDPLDLTPNDVEQYLGLQAVARALDHHDVLEYWQSAPYLLNFMEDYALKKQFRSQLAAASPEFVQAVREARRGLLARDDIERFRPIPPANARLRRLTQETLDGGAWRCLWLPPALPYYRGTGPFANPALAAFTKRLVFSHWKVVPKTLAALLSYDAERRMMRSSPRRATYTSEQRAGRRLEFRVRDDHPQGMPVLALLYPCREFAEHFDPLRMASRWLEAGQTPTLEQIRCHCEERLMKRLLPLLRHQQRFDGPVDERWYWVAPLLLDAEFARRSGASESAAADWWSQEHLAEIWSGETATDDEGPHGWARHVEWARDVATGRSHLAPRDEPRTIDAGFREAHLAERDGYATGRVALELGPPPEDLARRLALLALGGPANVLYRALGRWSRRRGRGETLELRNAAARTAHAFRRLFERPEVTALVRQKGVAYWKSVLDYCAAGNLQAVLDEYVHLLSDDLGADEMEDVLAEKVRQSVGLGTSTVQAELIRVRGRRVESDGTLHLRTRFAMRFGDQDSEEGELTRADQVRAAFNSPFWPFVLVTTSIGQEGLDFHRYCHALTHWNLPSNPVDLEQREGRVHRYKGHALRKNVATSWQKAAGQAGANRADAWSALFSAAEADRPADGNDLFPFWLAPGPAQIESHIPALPHSRDLVQRDRLTRDRVLYRIVFGQNRQDDLVSYLAAHVDAERIEALTRDGRIDLSPPRPGDA